RIVILPSLGSPKLMLTTLTLANDESWLNSSPPLARVPLFLVALALLAFFYVYVPWLGEKDMNE
ncbi:hypothetical protein A2U01_0092118, partial [Trifolium medium]|nr:hypothetical protein [Trifolium medium]